MKIAVVGTGYVGLVAGTCFAESGNDVTCVDIDQEKIDLLRSGKVPIYEPGLEEMIKRNVEEERLKFTTSLADAVKRSLICFICVGTPPKPDGSPDLKYVIAAAQEVARAMDGYRLVVCKSTVPVGTADKVRAAMKAITDQEFDVVSNPEFLKEGAAIDDFLKPDRVVIGTSDVRAAAIMKELYSPFVRTGNPILSMDNRSAELTKYAANALLAARISFINEIANLAELVGADVNDVRQGIGSDARIGHSFLFPGVGYGGSCLEGRETVLVRQQGRVRLTRLDALYEEVAAGGLGGLEVLSWRVDSPPEFLPVSAVTRREYEGEILAVRTKMGRRVRATPDHPFVVSNGELGEPRVKLASELTDQDWLPIALGAPVGEAKPPHRFSLLESLEARGTKARAVIVRPPSGTLPPHGEIADAIAPLGHPRGARIRSYDIARSEALRLDEARALGLDLERTTLGTARNGTYVPSVLVADADFWHVVGLYLAEGHCSTDGRRKRLEWSFHLRDEPDLVDAVSGYWKRLGVKAQVYAKTTSMSVNVSSRILADFFLRVLRVGSGAYDHRIPDAIWDQPESLKRALLAGLWRGDGSWSFIAGGPSVVLEYGTVSRELACGILRLLGELGVVARLKVGRTTKSTCDTYWLVVAGADQVEKLLDLVPESDRPRIQESIARQAKRIAPTGYRREGSVAWARVVEKVARPFQGFVYSLEVPDTETFVTTGGLVVHNCFPKDVDALGYTAKEHGYDFKILTATNAVNREQKRVLFKKAHAYFKGDLKGRKIAVWGLAFKPRTDDMREAPSIDTITALLEHGAIVRAFDPIARDTARKVFGDRIEYAKKQYDALEGAEALLIITEWNEFRRPDFDRMKALMARPVIMDGRNLYDPKRVAALGFEYFGIGVRGKSGGPGAEPPSK